MERCFIWWEEFITGAWSYHNIKMVSLSYSVLKNNFHIYGDKMYKNNVAPTHWRL